MSSVLRYHPSTPQVAVGVRGWTFDQLTAWGMVAALVFLMGADFRGSTGGDFEVHWQIYLRLLMAFCSGVFGVLLLFPRSYRDFLTWPGMLVSMSVAWYLVTISTSVSKSYSAAAWVSLLGVSIFVPGALRLLGGFRFLTALASGLSLFLVGSWFAYLFVPEVGVFQEQVTRTDVFERMGGLAHPNELGFYSAYTVLVFAGLGVSRKLPWTIAGLGMMLGAATLLGCFSRTAIIVCAFGLLFVFQNVIRQRGYALLSLISILACSAVLFFAIGSGKLDWAIERSLKGLSKSGSTDELATATGRTEIWAYSIKKISERPVRGYGYCSARFVMEEYSYHCHNIVLNAMMFGGIIAGFLCASAILHHVYCAFLRPVPAIDGLAMAMVAGGMVEGLLPAPSPAASYIIWVMLLFWRQQGNSLEAPETPQEDTLAGGATALR